MSETDTVYIRQAPTGAWVAASEVQIPNRAMNFGDGLFETMVFDGATIRFFDFHLERLRQGMELLQIEGFDSRFYDLETWIRERFSGRQLRVRWNVYRAGAGKYTPEVEGACQTLHLQPFAPAPAVKGKTSFAEEVSLFPFPWSACKTLSALPYVMAAQERRKRGLDELILTDYRGKISEASSSNIFWRRGKKVYTPALGCGCIAGVGRRAILEKIPRLVTEGAFGANELLGAEQVWTSNVTGVSYLEKIDSVEFSTEPWEPLLEIFE